MWRIKEYVWKVTQEVFVVKIKPDMFALAGICIAVGGIVLMLGFFLGRWIVLKDLVITN